MYAVQGRKFPTIKTPLGTPSTLEKAPQEVPGAYASVAAMQYALSGGSLGKPVNMVSDKVPVVFVPVTRVIEFTYQGDCGVRILRNPTNPDDSVRLYGQPQTLGTLNTTYPTLNITPAGLGLVPIELPIPVSYDLPGNYSSAVAAVTSFEIQATRVGAGANDLQGTITTIAANTLPDPDLLTRASMFGVSSNPRHVASGSINSHHYGILGGGRSLTDLSGNYVKVANALVDRQVLNPPNYIAGATLQTAVLCTSYQGGSIPSNCSGPVELDFAISGIVAAALPANSDFGLSLIVSLDYLSVTTAGTLTMRTVNVTQFTTLFTNAPTNNSFQYDFHAYVPNPTNDGTPSGFGSVLFGVRANWSYSLDTVPTTIGVVNQVITSSLEILNQDSNREASGSFTKIEGDYDGPINVVSTTVYAAVPNQEQERDMKDSLYPPASSVIADAIDNAQYLLFGSVPAAIFGSEAAMSSYMDALAEPEKLMSSLANNVMNGTLGFDKNAPTELNLNQVAALHDAGFTPQLHASRYSASGGIGDILKSVVGLLPDITGMGEILKLGTSLMPALTATKEISDQEFEAANHRYSSSPTRYQASKAAWESEVVSLDSGSDVSLVMDRSRLRKQVPKDEKSGIKYANEEKATDSENAIVRYNQWINKGKTKAEALEFSRRLCDCLSETHHCDNPVIHLSSLLSHYQSIADSRRRRRNMVKQVTKRSNVVRYSASPAPQLVSGNHTETINAKPKFNPNCCQGIIFNAIREDPNENIRIGHMKAIQLGLVPFSREYMQYMHGLGLLNGTQLSASSEIDDEALASIGQDDEGTDVEMDPDDEEARRRPKRQRSAEDTSSQDMPQEPEFIAVEPEPKVRPETGAKTASDLGLSAIDARGATKMAKLQKGNPLTPAENGGCYFPAVVKDKTKQGSIVLLTATAQALAFRGIEATIKNNKDSYRQGIKATALCTAQGQKGMVEVVLKFGKEFSPKDLRAITGNVAAFIGPLVRPGIYAYYVRASTGETPLGVGAEDGVISDDSFSLALALAILGFPLGPVVTGSLANGVISNVGDADIKSSMVLKSETPNQLIMPAGSLVNEGPYADYVRFARNGQYGAKIIPVSSYQELKLYYVAGGYAELMAKYPGKAAVAEQARQVKSAVISRSKEALGSKTMKLAELIENAPEEKRPALIKQMQAYVSQYRDYGKKEARPSATTQQKLNDAYSKANEAFKKVRSQGTLKKFAFIDKLTNQQVFSLNVKDFVSESEAKKAAAKTLRGTVMKLEDPKDPAKTIEVFIPTVVSLRVPLETGSIKKKESSEIIPMDMSKIEALLQRLG